MTAIATAEGIRYQGSIAELAGQPVVDLAPCKCHKCHYVPAGNRSRFSAVVLDEYNERVELEHVRPESVPAPAPQRVETSSGLWFHQAGAEPVFFPNA